jgi:hypothetical protein
MGDALDLVELHVGFNRVLADETLPLAALALFTLTKPSLTTGIGKDGVGRVEVDVTATLSVTAALDLVTAFRRDALQLSLSGHASGAGTLRVAHDEAVATGLWLDKAEDLGFEDGGLAAGFLVANLGLTLGFGGVLGAATLLVELVGAGASVHAFGHFDAMGLQGRVGADNETSLAEHALVDVQLVALDSVRRNARVLGAKATLVLKRLALELTLELVPDALDGGHGVSVLARAELA